MLRSALDLYPAHAPYVYTFTPIAGWNNATNGLITERVTPIYFSSVESTIYKIVELPGTHYPASSTPPGGIELRNWHRN